MFELADSGSSGGLSLRLSISLSFSFVLFSSSPPGVSLSPPLPFHLLCDAVPCCVGTGVRDRVASDRARTRSPRSPRSPRSLVSHLSDLSLPPFRVSYLFRSLSLPLSFSLFHAPPARFLSFPANEQADRAWAARIAFPSTPGRFHDPTYTFGCTCSRGILSRPVAQSQPTCCIAHFLPETYSYTPKAVSTTENCTFAYRVYRRRAYRDRACDFYAQWE